MGGASAQVGVVDILSSDDDQEGGGAKVAVRPRQRSIKRKKTGFTNKLTSDQLVSANFSFWLVDSFTFCTNSSSLEGDIYEAEICAILLLLRWPFP